MFSMRVRLLGLHNVQDGPRGTQDRPNGAREGEFELRFQPRPRGTPETATNKDDDGDDGGGDDDKDDDELGMPHAGGAGGGGGNCNERPSDDERRRTPMNDDDDDELRTPHGGGHAGPGDDDDDDDDSTTTTTTAAATTTTHRRNCGCRMGVGGGGGWRVGGCRKKILSANRIPHFCWPAEGRWVSKTMPPTNAETFSAMFWPRGGRVGV